MFRLIKSSRFSIAGSSKAKHLSKFQKSFVSKVFSQKSSKFYVFELFVVFFSLSYELFFPVSLQNSEDESRRLQGGMPACQKG